MPIGDALVKLVAPETWKANGGQGELAIIESRIIVRQTRDVHRQVREFLEQLGEYSFGSGPGVSGKPGSGFFRVE